MRGERWEVGGSGRKWEEVGGSGRKEYMYLQLLLQLRDARGGGGTCRGGGGGGTSLRFEGVGEKMR